MTDMKGALRILSIAVSVAAASCATAQSADALAERMRKGHPRMFFNSASWPEIKARAHGDAGGHLDRLLKSVDSYPEDPKCSGMGPVVFRKVKTATGSYETTRATPINTVKEWGVQAAECALAWRFTGKPEYLAKAKRMLAVSIAAYHEAYRNGREVCWYSNSRIMAMCAYDWIWEALTPDERRSIIVPLVQHVEETHPRRGRKDIIRRNASDYRTGFYGVKAMLWYSGLAAYGDGFCDDLAKRHLEEGCSEFMKLLKYREESAGDDGGLVSAVPGYCMGMYPYTHFNFLHTWKSAFGENLAERYPALALFPNWIYWTWIRSPDGPRYSGFGDDQHSQNMLPMLHFFGHMTHYMHFFRSANPPAARLAAALRGYAPNRSLGEEFMPLYPFILDAAGYGVKPYSDGELRSLPLHARHFETLGQFLMRSGWDESSTYCTFTAGAGFRQHKHHDENNFTIYKHDFLALDSGSRGYETDHNLRYYYSQTVAHNCMLIHAPDEPIPYYWGPLYKGPEGKTNHGGHDKSVPAHVLAFETCDDFTYIASDVTKSYGKKCSECVRQFVHVLPDVFLVYDRVGVGDPSHRKEWILHTKNEPVVEGSLVRADCGKGRLFCRTLLPAGADIGKVGGKGREFWANGRNWELDSRFLKQAEGTARKKGRGPYYGSWRIEVKPGAPAKNDRFLHVLTACDTTVGAPPKTEKIVDGDHDGAVLTFPGVVRDGVRGMLVARFRFNRSGAVGGDVRLSFTPDGAAAAITLCDRPLSDAVLRQEGMAPLE